MNKSQKLIVAWLFLGCLLVYMMVVIGGVTRLTHSGLSIVNWNLLGKRPPSSEKDWTELFDAYKAYPEYQQVNFNFTVDEFKFIFWWEYSHRFLGRMIGVIFLVPFLLFWWKGFLSRNLLKKLAVLLLLGGFQGLLGWYMVKSGLDKLPRVSHFRLAAHLLSAFTVFGFTFWTALDLIYPLKEKVLTRPLKGIRWLSIFLFACIVVQILYGAFVAGLRAGLLCPTWPKMCGEWVHSSVWSLEPAWRNFIEGGAGVQFVHRTLALFIVLIIIILNGFCRRFILSDLQKKLVHVLTLVVGVQFILGVLTLLNGVPLVLAVLHQTGAFFLFGTSLYLLHALRHA